ncbi:uncharacterized protein LOC111318928 [Stylophora pistillata]|uniref:uncharacterized protein LOC111318928 n=1 Tax=Stylophora pistillata TaxID=50429 RepID=UPI000C04FE9E|nr:uncharacterized protein LOC111318928 [Stylophora pistillata]
MVQASGQQTTRFSYQWMVSTLSPTKKPMLTRQKGSAGCYSIWNITSGSTLSRLVTGLEKYTEYEFQVLAYTSDGDGPKGPVKVERTQGDGCVQYDLGMEGGNIPDSRITASSSRTPAKNGRLNYALGAPWCAETNDTSPYLQVDLQTLHILCAVSTQGNSQADQWVKDYTLQISTDETTWTDYKEGGQVKFLRGNDDRNSEVKHVVYGVLTRFLRFLPQTHQGGVCMKLEVFGVEKVSDEEFLILYDFFEPRNPEFPHKAYAKFDLDEMAESESLAEFRFRKRDIFLLAEVLDIPETIRCDQRSICGGIEGYVCCLGGFHIHADTET